MIDSFKNETFDFDPGDKMAYNNSGYFLLGAIIEKVSGKSFNDYLRDTFFEPLGMHDTGVHTSTAVLKHEATGYSYEGGKPTKAINWDMSRAGAAAHLYSTVEDLMRWNEGVLRRQNTFGEVAEGGLYAGQARFRRRTDDGVRLRLDDRRVTEV